MKKLFLIQLSALLLIIFTAAATGMPSSDKAVIIDLMETRIGILRYYYGGKMSFEDAKDNMAKITTDSLFTEDVALMEGFEDTEVDQITDYRLNLLSCQRTSYGIIKGKANVQWVLFGPDGYWETEETYFYTAEASVDGTKLTQLKKL